MHITRSFWAVAAGTLLISTNVAALAQKPAKGQKQGSKATQSLASLPVSGIDAVVKLTPDQKTKVTAIHDKYATESKSLRAVKGAPVDPANVQKLKALSVQASKEIMDVLTPEQQGVLKSSVRDISAVNGVGIPPALALELKLTDDQKAKLVEVGKEVREKVKAGAKKKDVVLELKPKIAAILTADQQSMVAKYMAEHGKGKKKKP